MAVAGAEKKADYDGWAKGRTMRYVIGVCLLTGFLIWDAASNNGRFLEYTVLELKRVTTMLGV